MTFSRGEKVKTWSSASMSSSSPGFVQIKGMARFERLKFNSRLRKDRSRSFRFQFSTRRIGTHYIVRSWGIRILHVLRQVTQIIQTCIDHFIDRGILLPRLRDPLIQWTNPGKAGLLDIDQQQEAFFIEQLGVGPPLSLA